MAGTRHGLGGCTWTTLCQSFRLWHSAHEIQIHEMCRSCLWICWFVWHLGWLLDLESGKWFCKILSRMLAWQAGCVLRGVSRLSFWCRGLESLGEAHLLIYIFTYSSKSAISTLDLPTAGSSNLGMVGWWWSGFSLIIEVLQPKDKFCSSCACQDQSRSRKLASELPPAMYGFRIMVSSPRGVLRPMSQVGKARFGSPGMQIQQWIKQICLQGPEIF